MQKTLISGWQLCLLLVGAITVMGHLFIVPLVLDDTGRDAWLSLLIALVPGLALVMILSWIGRLKPQKTWDQIGTEVFGQVVGKMIALVYALYFIVPPALSVRGLMEFMNTAFLPNTPRLVIGFIFLMLGFFAVLAGLESVARMNAILMPILIVAGFLAASLAMPEKEYQRLLPIMEDGVRPVMQGSLPLIGLFGEMVVIGVIQGTVKDQAKLTKYNLAAILIIGLLFIGPLTGPVAMFGESESVKFDYPTYAEMKRGSYLVGFQSLAVVLWLLGSFGRVALFYYASVISAAQFLGLSDYRRLAAPTGLVILVIAQFVFPELTVVKKFLKDTYPIMALSMGIAFPAILLLGLLVKIQGREKLPANTN